MKVSAIITTLIILLATPVVVLASNYSNIENDVSVNSNSGNSNDSSSSVNITNNVNSDTNKNNISKTSTTVQMNQTGSGHSKVSINGKTYELNGAGNITVNENSDDSVAITPTESPIPEPTNQSSVKGASTMSPFEVMRQFFASLKNFIKDLFS